MTWDGSVSIYGCTVNGQMQVAVVPGGVNYSPGVLVASIFMEPSPIIITGSSQIIPVNLTDVSQFASYDMTCYANDLFQGTAGHALTFTIQLDWFDDLTSNTPVFTEVWHPWVVTGVTQDEGIVASGPMHGQYLTITVTNSSTHPITLDYLSLYGSPRNTQLSDWRQNPSNNVNDHADPNIPNTAIGYDNVLGDTAGFTPLAVGIKILPLALYSGPARYFMQSGAPLAGSWSIVDIGSHSDVVSGSISQSEGAMDGDVLTQFERGEIFMPRAACLLLVNVTTAGTFAFKLTAQQGP